MRKPAIFGSFGGLHVSMICTRPWRGRMAWKLQFVALAAVAFVTPGCPSDPNVDFYTTTEPQMADLAGRYTLTSQSVQKGGLARLAGKPSVVELRDDGTFTATNVPASGTEPEDEKFFSKLVSGSGTWKIAEVGSIANGGKPPKTHWGISFSSETCEILHAGLTGTASPYGLLFTLGDPDAARVMFFERDK